MQIFYGIPGFAAAKVRDNLDTDFGINAIRIYLGEAKGLADDSVLHGVYREIPVTMKKRY